VVHGDTWNMGHELHLAADIRVASADVRYGQNENAHGRVSGTVPVRFVREAGWANAMRYLLIGDYWDAPTAYRMGMVGDLREEIRHAPVTPSQRFCRIGHSVPDSGAHPSSPRI
jgi:enoyl-CoA hydratase/carnithine racemase